MELDDFLKPKKVRCVNNENRRDLTRGKLYDVAGATYGRLKIRDDNGGISWHDMDFFELVIESAENPLQGMELTPEFEAVEPKFKVGDKVYVGLTGKIARVTKIIDDDVVNVANKNNEVRAWISNICHATQENYERLQTTFPDIKFEQPPKPLTGSDLARDLIKKGWCGFNCVCGNSGDDNVMITTIVTGTNNSGQFVDFKGRLFNNAIPMLGSYPLTQAVLDE